MGNKGKSRVSQKLPRFEAVRGEGDAGDPGVTVAAVIGMRQADWAVRNSRRFSLIARQFSQGLDPDEEVELRELQAEADRYLDEAAPLPFQHLEKLEERVRLLAVDPVGSDRDQPDSS